MSRSDAFDPTLPIERARTPPSSWYIDPRALDQEKERVFRRTWQAAGPLDHVLQPGQYLAGSIADEPFVVVRGHDAKLRAFFNVCRHHASCIVEGRGASSQLVCPYHGWTYDLDGRLRRAPRMGGIEEFDRDRLGLVPMEVAAWGPIVFVRPRPAPIALDAQLEPLTGRLDADGMRFVTRRTWEIDCNWKVYVDNYLDGGYHVAHLHRALAAQLDLDAYATEVHERLSIQHCPAGAGDPAEAGDFKARLGRGAIYAFVYPNFMLNRYGPILDTNWVVPLGPERTLTVFDYWFDADLAERDPGFVERSLEASARVQEEDVRICEAVQRGLRSSAYDTGLYAPRVEQAAYQFHRRLAADLAAD